MGEIQKQIDELEAIAIEKELIANLATCQEAKLKNIRLAQSLREQAALLKDVQPAQETVR